MPATLLATLAVAAEMTAAVAAARNRDRAVHDPSPPPVWSHGGPRLPGPLGRLELTSNLARLTISGDEMIGPGVVGGATLPRLLRSRSALLLDCYEAQLHVAPGLAGRVEIRLTVQTWGVLTDVSATERTTGFDEVADCATRVVAGMPAVNGARGGSATFPLRMEFEPLP